MKKELVSIIIPVYNVKKYLRRCIRTILNQTYNNLEIILIDDGSTDGSGEECEIIAKSDNRIIVFHKENGGLSDARNYGLNRCSGDYLFFVDSDDYIRTTTIEDLIHLIREYNADIVECGVQYVYGDEEEEFQVLPEYKIDIYKHQEAVRLCLEYKFKIMAWNKLYRRELFDNIMFPKGLINEDEFTIPYIVDKAKIYVRTSKKCYGYYQRDGSIMNSKISDKNLALLEAQDKKLIYFAEKYNSTYDGIILYHSLCACSVLRAHKKKSDLSKDSQIRIEEKAKELCFSILKNPNIPTKIKIKAISTYLSPGLTVWVREKNSRV